MSEPSLLIANHFSVDTTWTLLFKKPSIKEFLNSPIKDHGYLSNKINTYAPQEGVLKVKQGQNVNFMFTSNRVNVSHDAHLVVIKNAKEKPVVFEKELKQNVMGQYVLEHEFMVKGNFTAQIFINSDLTFVYNVVVN